MANEYWIQSNFFHLVKSPDLGLDLLDQGFLERTLTEVAVYDYFPTIQVLRHIFVPNYQSEESLGIIQTLNWLKKDDNKRNLVMFSNVGTPSCGLNTLPKFARENYSTVSFYLEIGQEVEKIIKKEWESSDQMIAFRVKSPGFHNNLRETVYPEWVKLSSYPNANKHIDMNVDSSSRTLKLISMLYAGNANEYRAEAIDVLGVQLFRYYWIDLLKRFKLSSPKESHRGRSGHMKPSPDRLGF